MIYILYLYRYYSALFSILDVINVVTTSTIPVILKYYFKLDLKVT